MNIHELKYKIYHFIENFPGKWWLFHRFHPKHQYNKLETGLPPGYYDPNTQITYAIFYNFAKWYESDQHFLARTQEEIDEFISYDENSKQYYEANKENFDRLREIYHWWKETVKENIEQYGWEKIKSCHDSWDYKKVLQIEKEVYDEVTEKLIYIIVHRNELWY